MTDMEYGTPVDLSELDLFDGSYEEMKDRIPQEFDGIFLKGEGEKPSDPKFGDRPQIHAYILPIDDVEAKTRHQWYPLSEGKVSIFGALKASLEACGIKWERTREMISDVLVGAVFHWTEREIDTGRRKDKPVRLLPMKFLGYDARTRAELGLETRTPTYNRNVGETETVESEEVDLDEILYEIIGGGMTAAELIKNLPASVKANAKLMASLRNKKWFLNQVDDDVLVLDGDVYRLAE